jgi:hypothetical protein
MVQTLNAMAHECRILEAHLDPVNRIIDKIVLFRPGRGFGREAVLNTRAQHDARRLATLADGERLLRVAYPCNRVVYSGRVTDAKGP